VIHAFCIGAFLNDRPWAVVISNAVFNPELDLSAPPIDHFETHAWPADAEPFLLLAGAGVSAISAADWKLLRRIKSRRPSSPKDYRALLAGVNRRAAESHLPGSAAISPECVTAYLPPTLDAVQHESHQWGKPPSNSSLSVPFMLDGIDTTEMSDLLLRQTEASGTLLDHDVEAAAKRAITPWPK
jgi:hypothetical protein